MPCNFLLDAKNENFTLIFLYTFQYSEALLWDTVKLLKESLIPLGFFFFLKNFFFFGSVHSKF